MKKFSALSVKTVLVFLICAAFFSSCKKEAQTPGDALDKDTSYAFGMFMARVSSENVGLKDVHFDYKSFMEGFKAYNEAEETRLTWDKAMEIINTVVEKIHAKNNEKMKLEGEKSKEAGDAYLAENKAKSGVTTTASGLQYEVISQGSGAKPGPQDTVKVNYEGTLIDGTVFDSSYKRGEPAEFPVSRVIPGWVEGIQLMNVGSTYRFVIPSNLAYGENGAGSTIPPNSTLIFKVELLDIVKK